MLVLRNAGMDRTCIPSYLLFLHIFINIRIVHICTSVTYETGTVSQTQNYPAYALSLSLSLSLSQTPE